MARRKAHPGTHVYHYRGYEAGAIKRLMGRYATREDEVDQLLRGGVLVDLFSIVRQGVRVSQESYSLKKVEKLYMPEREGPKTRPGFALVEYEKWMESREPRILDSLAAYNRDDCVSIHRMRTWLEALRKEAESAFGITLGRPQPKEDQPSEVQAAHLEEIRRRVEALTEDVPADASVRSDEQQARWILAQLLDWHRRDAPRGMDFLYFGNRFNVAVSRARGLAVLVCSPDLLKVRCRTPEEMRLANALCRFVELSEPLDWDALAEGSPQ